MKVTLGCLRKADTDYKLIEAGDRVAIGISGGKDSLLLLHALSLYRKFSHKDFTIMAFTVSMTCWFVKPEGATKEISRAVPGNCGRG